MTERIEKARALSRKEGGKMSRLQRDAVKRLVVATLAAAAVGALYGWTHNPLVSMAGLFALCFLDLFLTSQPGPVMDREEVVSQWRRNNRRIRVVLFISALIGAIVGPMLLTASYRSPVSPVRLVFLLVAVPSVLLGIWIGERMVPVTLRRIPKPDYDERELLVLERSRAAGYNVFWGAFVLWSMAAWSLSRAGSWRPPDSVYLLQIFVAFWLFLTAQAGSVLWQEWRAAR